jgi:glycolate oxidase FAD binding subunit
MTLHAPADEAGVQAVVAEAYAARAPLLVQGGGTKAGMLRPVQAARTLSLAAHAGISLYAPKELIVTAYAGTPLAVLEARLAEAGQHMIAEPPDYTRLMGAGGQQTIGGITATNLSGPRRITGGAVRDHVLGVRAINGTGQLIKSGGRVLKNVTGLDLCKLLAGSHGTLAVLTEITLKVLPAPEDTASIILRGQSATEAVAALSAALGSPYGVSGAAYLPADMAAALGETTALTLARLEDFTASVSYRADRLRADLAAFGVAEIWPAARSKPAWTAIRHGDPLNPPADWAIWRVSVRPSRGPAVLAAAHAEGATGLLDWGGGLALLAGPATEALHAVITEAASAAGGVWTVLRAPAAWRSAAHMVPAEAPPLAALSRRVKAAFDPAGILNPGRIFAGV